MTLMGQIYADYYWHRTQRTLMGQIYTDFYWGWNAEDADGADLRGFLLGMER